MKLWRGDLSDGAAKLVECGGRYPSTDEDGRTVYDNTHFDTAEEAWDNIIGNVIAKCSLTADAVKRLREELRATETGAADALIEWRGIANARNAFDRQRAAAPSGASPDAQPTNESATPAATREEA